MLRGVEIMELPPGFRIPDDTSGCEWLEGRDGTHAWSRVGDAFPQNFEAFVRILHPTLRRGDPVRWSEAFAARGIHLGPGSSWFRDIGGYSDGEFGSPEDNSLPQLEATIVAMLIADHTETPDDCWFVWSPVRGLPFDRGMPLLCVRNRLDEWRVRRLGKRMSREAMRLERSLPSVGGGALLRGPLSGLIEARPTLVPSVWWPADHAWIVSTAVEGVSTYVAGSEACIGAVLAAEDLETVHVSPDDEITI